MFAESMFGHAQIALQDYSEDHMQSRQITDCKSLFDHIKTDAKVPDDRHVAIWVANLRSCLAAGAESLRCKTKLLWVASRWQLGDGLTKDSDMKDMLEHLNRGTAKLHEESAQAQKRGAAQKASDLDEQKSKK